MWRITQSSHICLIKTTPSFISDARILVGSGSRGQCDPFLSISECIHTRRRINRQEYIQTHPLCALLAIPGKRTYVSLRPAIQRTHLSYILVYLYVLYSTLRLQSSHFSTKYRLEQRFAGICVDRAHQVPRLPPSPPLLRSITILLIWPRILLHTHTRTNLVMIVTPKLTIRVCLSSACALCCSSYRCTRTHTRIHTIYTPNSKGDTGAGQQQYNVLWRLLSRARAHCMRSQKRAWAICSLLARFVIRTSTASTDLTHRVGGCRTHDHEVLPYTHLV